MHGPLNVKIMTGDALHSHNPMLSVLLHVLKHTILPGNCP